MTKVSHDVHETSAYSAARTGSEPGRVVTSTSTSTRIYCFTDSEVRGWAGEKQCCSIYVAGQTERTLDTI